MNCKPDDLAVVVRGTPIENIGKVVRVKRLVEYRGETVWDTTDPRWYYPDDCLRPIRDSDGADETLTWAGLPGRVEA